MAIPFDTQRSTRSGFEAWISISRYLSHSPSPP